MWYTNWFGTRYYAMLYGHRDEVEAGIWVNAMLERLHLARGSNVLDMACGRGRHARWFSEAGMNVTGIDLSTESIAEARRCAPRATFLVHDMREPLGRADQDLAICLFTSLGYSDDRDDDRRVVACAALALRPGGRFVLDFMNSKRTLSELVAEESASAGGTRFTIRRNYVDGTILKRITVHCDPCDIHFEERVSALSPDQLDALVLENGFTITDRTGGPPFTAFDPVHSDRYVVWAERTP